MVGESIIECRDVLIRGRMDGMRNIGNMSENKRK